MNKEAKLKELKIEVTQKCPLDCIHCSSEANITKSMQLNKDTVIKLLNEARDLGVEDIVFSGGEPLIWDDLCECLSYCSNLGLRTTVYSTCYSFFENDILFKNFVDSGVKNVVVSLFAANAREHEAISRRRGSFDRTIEGIKMLTLAGINVSIHFVAMKRNWRELAGIISLIQALKVKRISVLRFVPHGRGELVKDIDNLSREELRELKKEILSLRQQDDVNIRLGSPFNILSLESQVECLAAIDRIIIGPDGKIYPCDAFKNLEFNGALGSIYEGSLADIWNNSEYLNSVRKLVNYDLNPICSKCKNRSLCKGGCLAQKVIQYKGQHNFPDPDCLEGKGEILSGQFEQLKFDI
jgi:radical SAM protein with 4Fe4S-binding SPASM domain